MAATRTARLELRLSPAQKQLIARGADARGRTMTEYAVEVLVGAALRDTAPGNPADGDLGWMRGTAALAGDIVGPTDPEGWAPRQEEDG
jgi:hypothetical protein